MVVLVALVALVVSVWVSSGEVESARANETEIESDRVSESVQYRK